jgi:hypothetical protein
MYINKPRMILGKYPMEGPYHLSHPPNPRICVTHKYNAAPCEPF